MSAKSGYCTPHLVERCPKDRFQNILKAFAFLDLLGKEAKRGKRPNNPRANIPGQPSCSELRGSRLPPLKAGTQTQAGRLRTSSPASCSRVQIQTAPAARGRPAGPLQLLGSLANLAVLGLGAGSELRGLQA